MTPPRPPATPAPTDPLLRRRPPAAQPPTHEVHVYGNRVRCATDGRGHPTWRNRDRTELVVDAPSGFIPLWAEDVTLHWRFRPGTLQAFVDPAAAATALERLLAEGLLAWGPSVPVQLVKRESGWDFELVVETVDDCDPVGCVLAQAFFPDGGQHALRLYPKLFEQPRQEQVETLAHELGHVFGLRHFFAQVREQDWPSQLFGTHSPFSIMNYGAPSAMTDADRRDLARLYQSARDGTLPRINGTPIRLVQPFHALGHA